MNRCLLLISFVLSLAACQNHPAMQYQPVCDHNYAHCPDENEHVVSQQINSALN